MSDVMNYIPIADNGGSNGAVLLFHLYYSVQII